MEIILILIPVTLAIVGIAVAAFFWAVDNGQYDDAERSGAETLFADEDRPAPPRDATDTPTAISRGAP